MPLATISLSSVGITIDTKLRVTVGRTTNPTRIAATRATMNVTRTSDSLDQLCNPGLNVSCTSIVDLDATRSSDDFRLNSPILDLSGPLYQSTPMTSRRRRLIDCSDTDEESFVAKRRRIPVIPSSQLREIDTSNSAYSMTSDQGSLIFDDFDSYSAVSDCIQLDVSLPSTDDSFQPSSLSRSTQPEQTSESSSAGVSILGSNCCHVRCLASFNLLEIEGFQTSFKNRTRTDQQQFILDAIAVAVSKDRIKESNIFQHYLTLSGKQVCIAAFSRILGISRKRFDKVKELYSQGVTCATVRCYDRRKSTKYSTAVAWMDRYFDRIGDKMPHVEQIQLPHFLSKKTVYELMVQHLQDEGICREDIVSSSHFYSIWKENFHNCVIPKVRLSLIAYSHVL